jgi:hypothetical protein
MVATKQQKDGEERSHSMLLINKKICWKHRECMKIKSQDVTTMEYTRALVMYKKRKFIRTTKKQKTLKLLDEDLRAIRKGSEVIILGEFNRQNP